MLAQWPLISHTKCYLVQCDGGEDSDDDDYDKTMPHNSNDNNKFHFDCEFVSFVFLITFIYKNCAIDFVKS